MLLPPVMVPVTAISAAGAAMVAEMPAIPDALQYGALGLCAVMVVLNWIGTRDMAKRLDKDRQEVVDLHKQTMTTMGRLCQGLEDRPCLIHDQRIKPAPE